MFLGWFSPDFPWWKSLSYRLAIYSRHRRCLKPSRNKTNIWSTEQEKKTRITNKIVKILVASWKREHVLCFIQFRFIFIQQQTHPFSMCRKASFLDFLSPGGSKETVKLDPKGLEVLMHVVECYGCWTKNRGILPQNGWWKFHGKPYWNGTIWGFPPYFWKHPYVYQQN